MVSSSLPFIITYLQEVQLSLLHYMHNQLGFTTRVVITASLVSYLKLDDYNDEHTHLVSPLELTVDYHVARVSESHLRRGNCIESSFIRNFCLSSSHRLIRTYSTSQRWVATEACARETGSMAGLGKRCQLRNFLVFFHISDLRFVI